MGPRSVNHARLLAYLTLVLASSGCHPLDRRAPFASARYTRQHRAAQDAIRSAPTLQGPLSAGWSKAEIRVSEDVPLAGYGDRDGVPNEGIRDPAAIRAYALSVGSRTALLFTADILLVGRGVAERVRGHLSHRLAERDIFFTASHTHSGPGGSVPGIAWEAAMGPFSEAAQAEIVRAHVEAGLAALEDISPARVGHASVAVPGLSLNRVERDGPVDDELLVIRFSKLEGGRSAAIWVYGCHPVTLPAENLRVSGDYPSMVGAIIEGKDTDLLGFAAGGVGSTNPRHDRPHDQSWIIQPLALALKSALRSASRAERNEIRLTFANLRLRHPPLHYRIFKNVEVWAGPVSRILDMPYVDYGALVIDNLVLSFMPAEISGSLTRRARIRARKNGLTLAMLPFNGTYLGYVVPRRVYDLPQNAATTTDMLHYETHVVSFLGPWGADYLLNIGLTLAGGLHARLQLTDRATLVGDTSPSSTPELPNPLEAERPTNP